MKITIDSKKIFLLLTIIVGLIAVYPQIVYQPYLLQGDHGRDLYIFQQTTQGALPYIDYRTDNGPLMPFYYGLFINVFGNTIQSVLLGYAVMIFLAGLLIFLISRKVIAPHFAFLCALWYWAWRGQEFFYTFNHIGALAAGLAVVFFTVRSLEKARKRYFIGAFLCSLLCILIRPNIGLASFTGFLLISFIYKRKNYKPPEFFLIMSFISIISSLIVLFFFIPETSNSYMHSIHWHSIAPNILNFVKTRWGFLTQNIFITGLSLLLGLLFIKGIILIFITRHEAQTKKLFPFLVAYIIFFILFFMEFLLGIRFFRWVWVMPILFIFIFTIISYSLKTLSQILKNIIFFFLLAVTILMLYANYNDLFIAKRAGTQLVVGKNALYMSPTQQSWIDTVEKTSERIRKFTDPDEMIAALPYDNIYCFLTNRKSAAFKPSILNENSQSTFKELRNANVPLIIVSNRAFRYKKDERFGIFGKDYGINIWNYIQKNYVLVDQIGPWEKTATAIQNHATRVYLHKFHINRLKNSFMKNNKNGLI